MAFEQTKEYVLSMLGYPTVAVELTEGQLNMCIKEATMKYFEYRTPKLKYAYFNLNSGQADYDLPQEILDTMNEQGLKIKKVVARPSNFEQFQYFFQYQLYNYRPVRISNIYLMFQNLETFMFSTGQFINWELIEGNKIRLAPVPTEGSEGAIVYATNDEDSELDLNPWIWKYTLAKAKYIVGTVRSKFSIPSPNGDTSTINGGENLKTESATEQKQLIEELIAKSEPMPIIVG